MDYPPNEVCCEENYKATEKCRKYCQKIRHLGRFDIYSCRNVDICLAPTGAQEHSKNGNKIGLDSEQRLYCIIPSELKILRLVIRKHYVNTSLSI